MNNLRWNFIYSFILSHRVLVAWFEFVFFLMWSVKEVFKQRLFCLKQTKAAVFPSSRRRCLKLLEQTAADSVQWEERERCLMTLSTQFSHLQRKKGHSEEISHRVVYLRTCITMFLGYSLTLSPQFKTQNIHQALPNTDSFIHWFIDWFRCASLQTLEGWRHRMVFFSWVFFGSWQSCSCEKSPSAGGKRSGKSCRILLILFLWLWDYFFVHHSILNIGKIHSTGLFH